MSAAYIHVHFRLDVIMETNATSPDQIVNNCCLQNRLSKNISRRVEQKIKMVKSAFILHFKIVLS